MTGPQTWSWALAILLALAACAVVLWWRGRGGSASWRKAGSPVLKRLGGTRLNAKVSLEVVEFGGRRLLLSVSDAGAHEIARDPVAGKGDGEAS